MRYATPSVIALSFVTAIPFVGAHSQPPIPTPTVWRAETSPPSSCGHPLRITAAMPQPESGQDGEWLTLVNVSPMPVAAAGWELVVGRRRRRLPSASVGPGAQLTLDASWLGSMHLRNKDGHATLVDPCGAEIDRITWEDTFAGVAVLRDPP